MNLRRTLLMALALTGCELHSYPSTAVVHKKAAHYHEKVYVESHQKPVVYVEEVYVCEPAYDPVGVVPTYCTDYGVGVGYCCTYEYGDWDFYCAEEWCWWEDMCYWDPIETVCSELYQEVT